MVFDVSLSGSIPFDSTAIHAEFRDFFHLASYIDLAHFTSTSTKFIIYTHILYSMRIFTA